MTVYSAWDFVEMLNSRDSSFFSLVHGRYFRRMLVVCLKKGIPRDQAEDMVTDIFIYLYTKGRSKTFDSPSAVSNYLFKSIFNKCISFRKERNSRLQSLHDSYAGDNGIFDLIEVNVRERYWAAVSDRFRIIFDNSKYRQLDILRMLYLEQRSVPEIANEMGIAEQTVRNHKTKGLKMLAHLVSKSDFLIRPILFLLLLSIFIH